MMMSLHLCIATVCMATLPARSRTVFQNGAAFLSIVCGKQEMHQKGLGFFLVKSETGGVKLPLV